MGNRLVVDAGEQGTDESVGRIRPESELPGTLVAPKVDRDRFANDLGHRDAAARSPTHQLLVSGLGKAEIRRSISRHCGLTISLGLGIVKLRATPNPFTLGTDAAPRRRRALRASRRLPGRASGAR